MSKVCFHWKCEEGFIKGVTAGNYNAGIHNKSCAIAALKLIKQYPELSLNQSLLWKKVLEKLYNKVEKSHNNQMDVVLSLLKKDFIK